MGDTWRVLVADTHLGPSEQLGLSGVPEKLRLRNHAETRLHRLIRKASDVGAVVETVLPSMFDGDPFTHYRSSLTVAMPEESGWSMSQTLNEERNRTLDEAADWMDTIGKGHSAEVLRSMKRDL